LAEPVFGSPRKISQSVPLALEHALARNTASPRDIRVPSRDSRREVPERSRLELPVVVDLVRIRPKVLAGDLGRQVIREEVPDAHAAEEKIVLIGVARAVDLLVLTDEAVTDVKSDVSLAGERRGRINAVAHLRGGLRGSRRPEEQGQGPKKDSEIPFRHRQASASNPRGGPCS